ncbi:MAG: 6,7-dimethyl-8-ribityllumazine synthase [Desulfovibrio sp.]|nr:6,7-dimethyl-8-ribityllumazine synthase [Desulfovibrio sp.]
MPTLHTIDGSLLCDHHKIAIVATRFNSFIVNNLVTGALDCLERHGASQEDITLIHVPGAFELPLVCQKVAKSKRYDALIALGAVIRGATPHFDYVCTEASKGIAQVMLNYEIPIGFGLLTCDTIDQAIERAGSKAGNKGVEAALAMLETLHVLEQL